VKLFENQRKSSDEFTKWCEEFLSKFQTPLDVPTFVSFLKACESPFDVNDYVRSYLGENKESRDFAKQFLEKRSFYRDQQRKQDQEQTLWGPAPAITPSINKLSGKDTGNTSGTASSTASVNSKDDKEESSQSKGKGKKKKGKRLVDNSLLGFTVQADPDRIKSGEIHHFED